MFNIKKLFTKSKSKTNEPSGIHSKHNQHIGYSNSESLANQAKQKEINDRRQAQFEKLGISYTMVVLAEAHGIKNIDPEKLATETSAINNQLAILGFNIRINCLESFECQLLYLDYQRLRINKQASGIHLPDHNLVEIIVLKEAEKIIRNKYKLEDNPTTGNLATKFQSEVKQAFEFLFKKSANHQLRQQAEIKIRQDRKLAPTEAVPEIEILNMMERISQQKK
ncbi:hypothetical protein GW933_03180 [Candidatus Falkowbacteria bacterium]|uniref:Uncharacterized protein n=1 Tax=Candidatus Buchananbacteria bacterium CG10_big_fil_rev_8_21_14_0_10_33_19 TaxID=1974525 RepID=A0A2H0W4M9_9BACT|nr:hypothetical protein [Candidatus Falkowbacteria bacterium]PIS06306.1 MAG: hypothetical protein COT80_01925 [Candidatus Buchananbacteria bacterium CG10_big_fil_rev_8_21_14_0_10_33_19]